jgi:hypothetical protein
MNPYFISTMKDWKSWAAAATDNFTQFFMAKMTTEDTAFTKLVCTCGRGTS